MRKYSKKRNHKKRMNKRTRNKRYKRSKNKRMGGFNGSDNNNRIVKCVSEGCVYYPSIIGRNDAVTKLYLNERLYNKELESYRKFTEVDPDYLYHCRVFANGLLKFEEIEHNLGRNATELNAGKDYYYIDIEYAGETIGNANPSVFTSEFKNKFIHFLINVLKLRNKNEEYLVHGDPHPGNICYKTIDGGQYLIRYIDITTAIFVLPSEIVRSNTEITFQFASLLGCVRTVFGFNSSIANNLLKLNMTMKDKSYETVVTQFIDILAQGDSAPETPPPIPNPSAETPSAKKQRGRDLGPPRRALFMDSSTESDESGSPVSNRSSYSDDLPRKIKPMKLF